MMEKSTQPKLSLLDMPLDIIFEIVHLLKWTDRRELSNTYRAFWYIIPPNICKPLHYHTLLRLSIDITIKGPMLYLRILHIHKHTLTRQDLVMLSSELPSIRFFRLSINFIECFDPKSINDLALEELIISCTDVPELLNLKPYL